MPRPAVPAAPPPGWGPRWLATTTVELGRVTLDVTEEAAVVGRLPAPGWADAGRSKDGLAGDVIRSAEAFVADGAVAVELTVPSGADPGWVAATVAALVEQVAVPVLVAADPAAPLEAALAAGAVAAVATGPLPEAHLAAVAAAGASLLVPGERSPRGWRAVQVAGAAAVAAGMAVERVLLEVGAAGEGRSGRVGLPVLVSEPPELDGRAREEARGDRSAALALGIALGGRVLRTMDPRAARRTSTALAAITQARHEGASA